MGSNVVTVMIEAPATPRGYVTQDGAFVTVTRIHRRNAAAEHFEDGRAGAGLSEPPRNLKCLERWECELGSQLHVELWLGVFFSLTRPACTGFRWSGRRSL